MTTAGYQEPEEFIKGTAFILDKNATAQTGLMVFMTFKRGRGLQADKMVYFNEGGETSVFQICK